jgi:hypothetical protein
MQNLSYEIKLSSLKSRLTLHGQFAVDSFEAEGEARQRILSIKGKIEWFDGFAPEGWRLNVRIRERAGYDGQLEVYCSLVLDPEVAPTPTVASEMLPPSCTLEQAEGAIHAMHMMVGGWLF